MRRSFKGFQLSSQLLNLSLKVFGLRLVWFVAALIKNQPKNSLFLCMNNELILKWRKKMDGFEADLTGIS